MFINNNKNIFIIFLACSDLDASCVACTSLTTCTDCGTGKYWIAG